MTGFLPMSEARVMLTRTQERYVGALMDNAEHDLSGELFFLDDAKYEDMFARTAERGVPMKMLLDPEYGEESHEVLGGLPNTTLVDYQSMPYKNHAKMLHGDDRSLFFTGAYTPHDPVRLEAVADLSGTTAAAARELTEAAMSGDPARMARSVSAASKLGIAINEPSVKQLELTRRLVQLIDDTQHELTISTKKFDAKVVRDAVARAERRGVTVKFSDLRAEDMHANLVIGDNQAYLGTAHLSARGLGDMTRAYRKAREVGVFSNDAATAARLRRQLDDEGMRVFTPDQFERSRVSFAKMDRYHALKDQKKRLGDKPGLDEKIAAAKVERDASEKDWQAITSEVSNERAADGMRFTPDAQTQAELNRLAGMDPGVAPVEPAGPEPLPVVERIEDEPAPFAPAGKVIGGAAGLVAAGGGLYALRH